MTAKSLVRLCQTHVGPLQGHALSLHVSLGPWLGTLGPSGGSLTNLCDPVSLKLKVWKVFARYIVSG